jgi:hypothetical protein
VQPLFFCWISIALFDEPTLCCAPPSSPVLAGIVCRTGSAEAGRKPAARAAALRHAGVFRFVHPPDSGEFGGQRITLQRFAEVDTVLYEYTAGGLSWPVVASDVTIDPRGQQFYFTVQPPDEDERTISGTLVTAARRWCSMAVIAMTRKCR